MTGSLGLPERSSALVPGRTRLSTPPGWLLLIALALVGCSNRLVDGVPRLYACDRAEGLNSCPGGWRCGLSGFCQDPTQALPYSCESSDDCSAAWHCGAERLCYDRATARDRSCRENGGDCAPSWR